MSSFTLSPADPLLNFDTDLQRFYLDVLSKELNVQIKRNAVEIRNALKEVVGAYKKETAENCANSAIRFDSPAKRCAYVLKHSPCFTSAVARHFLRLLDDNPHILNDAILRGEVNFCCLGGGPASDAVAFGKIVSFLYHPYWIECRQPLTLRFTIVDVNEDWEITAKNVLKTLRESEELGINGIDFAFEFCKADLTQPMAGRVKEVLKGADILTMVYFLSAVNRGKDKIESLQMATEIMRQMKKGAFLFFLDSATDVHYRQMDSAVMTLGNLDLIYGPYLEEFHTLSLESVKTFLELYKKDFERFVCLTNCFVSASAWIKSDGTLWIDRSFQSLALRCTMVPDEQLLWRKSNRNSVSNLTSRMLKFRSEVQKLLAAEFEQLSAIENDIFFDDADDVEDTFDCVQSGYSNCVPEYFFQTKSKKKRIFTGLPVSI